MELLKIQDLALHNYYIICEVIDDQMDNIKLNSLRDHRIDQWWQRYDDNCMLVKVMRCWWQKNHNSDIFLFVGEIKNHDCYLNFINSGKWLILNVGDMTWYQTP